VVSAAIEAKDGKAKAWQVDIRVRGRELPKYSVPELALVPGEEGEGLRGIPLVADLVVRPAAPGAAGGSAKASAERLGEGPVADAFRAVLGGKVRRGRVVPLKQEEGGGGAGRGGDFAAVLR
jgi:hypothetical protein